MGFLHADLLRGLKTAEISGTVLDFGAYSLRLAASQGFSTQHLVSSCDEGPRLHCRTWFLKVRNV